MNEKLLIRYINQQASEEEIKEVLDWFDQNPEEHLAVLNRVRHTLQASDVFGAPISPVRRLIRYAVSIAATAVLMVGAWYTSDWNTINKVSSRIVRLECPAGQRLQFCFEDGTQVWLNAGTTLEYPAVFARGVRRVKLSGEALFEVDHDVARPFIVETFASDIEVRGTRFNVDADAADNRFSVLLAEGSVEVRSRLDAGQMILMEPYDRVELVGDHLCKTQVKDFDALCWTEGIVPFGKMPFDRLMQRLERAYNIRIIINKDTLPQLEVRSGKLRVSDGIEYAMHVLQQLSDFTYRFDRERNIIEIQ